VVATGIDGVVVSRVASILARRPGFLDRVLSVAERERLVPIRNESARAASIAGRLAAKEATMKALQGGIWDLGFLDIEVEGGRTVPPRIVLKGRARARARSLMIDDVQVSLTHDGDLALASATALRWCACNPS
jgi:phosphopantetheine--protein transferase-like protein